MTAIFSVCHPNWMSFFWMTFLYEGRFHGVLADFAAAIHGGSNPNSPAEALADLAVIEAMMRSAESDNVATII